MQMSKFKMCTHVCESERVCRNHRSLEKFKSLWKDFGEIIIVQIPANGDISKC